MASVLPEIAAEGKGTLTDAWDSKGRPATRATTGGWGCAAMILGAELFERMTTLGIAVNLAPYMTGTMHLGSAAAANTVTNFIGTSFMLCLLGGFIADSYLGRYLTIAVFTAVQATGVVVLTVSTVASGLRPAPCADVTGQSPDCVPADGKQLGMLYLGLYMTALGTGGLKSSVSGFGSDQFDESDDGERKKMMRFFNWFYFFVSIGALLAVTVLVYVQNNIGRRWGYRARRVPGRHQEVPVQEARRKPADAGSCRHGRRMEQARPAAAVRPEHALRPRRRGSHRRGPQGEAEAAPQQGVPAVQSAPSTRSIQIGCP